jgi:hypothetical protein
MKRTKYLLLLLVALSLLLVAAQGEGEIPSFDEALQGASGPLVGAVVAVIISWVVEFVPAYGSLAPRYKRLVYFGLCMVVPVSAACLRATLGYVAWSFDPLVWQALWNGAAAGGVGTLVHARKLSAA